MWVLGDDMGRHGLDLVQAGEVGAHGAQSVCVDAGRRDEAVGGGAGFLGDAAVQKHGRTAIAELPGGLQADAGSGARDEDGTGRGVVSGMVISGCCSAVLTLRMPSPWS